MFKLNGYYISDYDAKHIKSLDDDLKQSHSSNDTYHYFDKIRQKKQTTAHTAIAPRTINYWTEIGLLNKLPTNKGSKWHKFSFVDLGFIHIVTKLRNFGMGLDKIKNAKTDLYNLISITDENGNVYTETGFSVLEYILFLKFAEEVKYPIYLLITNSGNVLYMNENALFINTEKNTLPDAYICLNVTDLLDKKQLIENFQTDFCGAKSKYKLNDNERQVLDNLRQDNVERLEITKNRTTGELTRMDAIKDITNTEDSEHPNYGDIQINFQHGQITRKTVKETTKFD